MDDKSTEERKQKIGMRFMKTETNNTVDQNGETPTEEFAQRVRANQAKRRSELSSHYDFIVCGSGSSGSVVAGRLAQNHDFSVLLIEAGGDEDVQCHGCAPVGHEYRKREILAVQRRAEPTPQRSRHSPGHGESFGRWIQHQRDD